MANYDGHVPKRQRTDNDSPGSRSAQPTFYNYATNQRGPRGSLVDEEDGGERPYRGKHLSPSHANGNDEDKVNHILLMTILNPAYPITVDVIHTICSPSGAVLRIVIFKKNGVQTMVEFDTIESAKRAKQSLHGADIYSGCCTLKIEYAKPARLNVYKNDNESWDYTNPNLNKTPDRPGPLLQEPRFGSAPTPYRGEHARGGPPPSYSSPPEREYDGYTSGGSSGRYAPPYSQYPQDHYSSQDRYPPPERGADEEATQAWFSSRDSYDGGIDGSSRYGSQSGVAPRVPQQGAVMMVYGLNHEKINSDRIFNLFCLYGNVVRVKFLKSKEGCAMVQMGDGAAVERAIHNLNNCYFFGTKMQLGYSKQAFLNDVQHPYHLPDGSPSFKDFMGNRNNRFTNPEAASKNRIQPPSKVLHFFNTPAGITEEELKKLFEDQEVTPPKAAKMFHSKNPSSERSSSGLLEWETTTEALEALVTANHTPIPNPSGKFPYILKLCFSSTSPRGM